ncbi:Putative RNA-binding protein [Podospora comata]|uniref:RNA-binding protein n=1 Tax=Podospora comata TaxID=48703 RepID=A0ABY6S4D9_PODCO|nr:Putative RNA-binding protein [Podospora comata]
MASDSSSPPSSPEVKKDKTSSKKRKTDLTEIEVDVNLPEPPSKKAKRLLKKGKSLPAKPKSDDEGSNSDSDTPKTDKTKKEKKERSPYGIWIGNLRFTVTKPELKQWFVDNSGGTITLDDITRVHLPTAKPTSAPGAGPKNPTENRGFAYVDFATFEANVAAIALSETEWYRRKVLIKDAKSFEGRPEKKEEPAPVDLTNGAKSSTAATTATPASTSTKVFVGNLSFQVTEDDLREHFHKCGPIRWVKVATFEDTGKCKGYGWVNFETADAAQWAVKGFVKVKETIDTVEDFMDVDEKEEDKADNGTEKQAEEKDGNDDEEKEEKPKKKAVPKEEPRVKTRKWWVNQLLGRTLKIELAEDDQTRYQKRFRGKGAAQRREQNDAGGEGVAEVKEKKVWVPMKERRVEAKVAKFHQDINVARLTGAVVAPAGKKTTFE